MSRIEDDTRYHAYFLKENPFPPMAVIDPLNRDIRYNGTIFNKEVFEEEVANFRKKIEAKVNLIYVTGGGWERGVGKSALIVQEWRRLKSQPDVTSVYIKVEPKSTPDDLCDDVVLKWHADGFLWETLKKVLLKYSEEAPSPKVMSSDVRAFLSTFPEITDEISFGLFSFLYKPAVVVSDMTQWICGTSPIAKEGAVRVFLNAYLTKPSSFRDEWLKFSRSKGLDKIGCFRTLMELMRIAGYKYHYFFFDQFEETVEPLRGASLSLFSTRMSSLLKACIGQAAIIVTLHPSAELTLSQPEGMHVRSLAGLDNRHKIDVSTMSPDEGVKLCLSYFSPFRHGKPESPLYPFEEDVVRYLTFLTNGIPRFALEDFNKAIEVGIASDYAKITLDFVKEHHEDITGKVFITEKLHEFMQYAK
jgi:hypothetical protein